MSTESLKQQRVFVPSGELPLGWCSLGAPGEQLTPLDPNSEPRVGERMETLKRLHSYESTLQSIQGVVHSIWRDAASVYLVGRAAIVELSDSDEVVNDLDILVTGVTEDDLRNTKFIRILQKNFVVEVINRVNITYLKLSDKKTGEHVADIDATYRPKSSDDSSSVVFAMQRMTTAIAAIEIQEDGYKYVPAYEDSVAAVRDGRRVTLPLAPGIQENSTRFASSMVRYPSEVSRTPFFTTTLENLNAIRKWWFHFRNTQHTIEEVTAISESIERALSQGFLDAKNHGMEEVFFTLLVHTGALHALFPYSWQLASHRLFGPHGDPDGSILETLRVDGFSFKNLNSALAKFIDPLALENISTAMREAGTELPEDWYTSFLYNCLVESYLVSCPFPLEVFIPNSQDEILVHDLLSARRPHHIDGDEVQQAKFMFWNIVGPYIESYILAEVLRLEALMDQASSISKVARPTSTFDRVGIVYERVQTYVARLVARGKFPDECKAALALDKRMRREIPSEIIRLIRIGVKFSTQVEIERKARFSLMFRYQLRRFHYIRELMIDDFTHRKILDIFKEKLPGYSFVFD